ncbi:not available [Yersinia enterocolitica]|nr:not available [Yersinia enterocolitica]
MQIFFLYAWFVFLAQKAYFDIGSIDVLIMINIKGCQ